MCHPAAAVTTTRLALIGGRHAGPQLAGRHGLAGADDGARRDGGVRLHGRAVEHGRAGADERLCAERARVHDRVRANHRAVADQRRVVAADLRDVHDRTVADRRPLPDRDLVHVAAQRRAVPASRVAARASSRPPPGAVARAQSVERERRDIERGPRGRLREERPLSTTTPRAVGNDDRVRVSRAGWSALSLSCSRPLSTHRRHFRRGGLSARRGSRGSRATTASTRDDAAVPTPAGARRRCGDARRRAEGSRGVGVVAHQIDAPEPIVTSPSTVAQGATKPALLICGTDEPILTPHVEGTTAARERRQRGPQGSESVAVR